MLHRLWLNRGYYNYYRTFFNSQLGEAMKFLLYIWELSRKIQRGVAAFLQKIPQTRVVADGQCESQPMAKLKRIRKRKSFHSFLREEDSQHSIHQFKAKSYRRRAGEYQQRALKSQEWRYRQNGIAAGEIEQDSRRGMAMTPEPVFSDSPLVFNDQNGLQISFIAQRKPIQEGTFDKDEESDSEILKFVYGSKLTPIPPKSVAFQKPKNGVFQRPKFSAFQIPIFQALPKPKDVTFQKDPRLWWQRVADGDDDESSLGTNSLKNGADRYNPEEKEGKTVQRDLMFNDYRNSRFQRGKGGKGRRANRFCVINLIDLVGDEDCPKMFQIPLSIERL